MNRLLLLLLPVICLLLVTPLKGAPTVSVSFSQSAASVPTYEFVEVTLAVAPPRPQNPFVNAEVGGQFQCTGGQPAKVDGFCDSADGSIYRVRFLPTAPGAYHYSVTWRGPAGSQTHSGSFRAMKSKRRGLVRVDKEHPWHFVWEGTGEHYFYNGTTTYFLMGWDDRNIERNLERLHRLGANRLRVAICGRVANGRAWFENVYPTREFSFLLNPWVAARPESVEDPGFDLTRFSVAYWQKWDRMLRAARDREMVISVVFYVDGSRPGTYPFGKERAGGEDEQRYYRYAAARFSAFSNVMWDVSNEYQSFRDDAWAEKMGTFLRRCDPYDHLTSVHGFEDFHFRASPWADFAMYQSWDESGGHGFMVENRRLQAETGRPMPQVNEEYGYEDHYPHWGNDRTGPPGRSADNRRRLAWGMYMAGGYQTTGERADRGTGWGPDTGGGWVNGRGDDTMTMLVGYRCIERFFRAFEWWKTEPHDDLTDGGAMCLAEPRKQYAIYLPSGGRTTVQLAPGTYHARRYNPRSGRWYALPDVVGPAWTSPDLPDGGDWALLLTRRS
jgi:hypothetical protein